MPYVVRGRRAVLRAARGARGDAAAARRGRRRQRARRRWCRRCATCWPRTGWAEHRPPPGGAARERWEALAALVDLAVDLVAENPTLDLAGFVGAAGRARRRAARADRAGRDAGLACTRPRAWSGTRCSWSGWSTATLPTRIADAGPRRSRRSAGCSTSAITRAREQLALSWSLARNPGAQAGAGRAAASSPAWPRTPAPTAPTARKAGQEAEGRARGRGGGAVRAAAGVAQPGGPGAVRPGLRGVHRRDAAGASPRPGRRTCGSSRACRASAPASSRCTARTCSPPSPADSRPPGTAQAVPAPSTRSGGTCR